jgi:hypothetical protein
MDTVLGRSLDLSIRVRVATREEILSLPDPELAAQLPWQFPDLRGNRFLATAYSAAREDSAAVHAAVADPRTGEILCRPDVCVQVAKWNVALTKADSAAFLQLALIEAAFQQYLESTYGLNRRWQACRDGEELQILQSLRAGRALWLTRQTARRLGTEAYFPLLVQRFRYLPNEGRDNALRLIGAEVMKRRSTVSAEGLAFCSYLAEHHWPEAEQGMFIQPPRQLAWLTRPELYIKAQQSSRQGIAALLHRIEASMPAQQWTASQEPWTPDMVRQAASLLGQEAKTERVLRSWGEAGLVVWSEKKGGRQVALSVVRFEDEAGARAYYGFANELQRKRDEMSNAPDAAMARVLDSRTYPCTVRPASEAVRIEKKLQVGGQGELTERKLLARAGDLVIEVAWYGMPDDTPWAEKAMLELLRP